MTNKQVNDAIRRSAGSVTLAAQPASNNSAQVNIVIRRAAGLTTTSAPTNDQTTSAPTIPRANAGSGMNGGGIPSGRNDGAINDFIRNSRSGGNNNELIVIHEGS